MLKALSLTHRMSQLPPRAIDEFQALWKKHFGQDLPREEAAARAHQTFAVLRMLIEPLQRIQPLPSSRIPPGKKRGPTPLRPAP